MLNLYKIMGVTFVTYFAVFLKVKNREVAVKFRDDHINYVKKMCQEGNIHLVGGLADAGGLIIFQAKEKKTVEHWVAQDPFVIHGARTYEIYEWDMQTAEEYLK